MTDQTTPAYECEELGLTETEKIAAAHAQRIAGQPSVNKIIAAARKHGIQDGVFTDAALGLPLDQYRRVEEVVRSLPKPSRKFRR